MGSLLPAAFPKEYDCRNGPHKREDHTSKQVEPVLTVDLVRQRGVKDVRGMVFECQRRHIGDVVLLTDQQDQGHDEHVAQRTEAGGSLRAGQRGDGHADAESADSQSQQSHPEEDTHEDGDIVNSGQNRRQDDAERRVKKEFGCQDLQGRSR